MLKLNRRFEGNKDTPPETEPAPDTPDCECSKNKNRLHLLLDFLTDLDEILRHLQFQSKVAMILSIMSMLLLFAISILYLYYIFVPVDAKVAVNQLNKDSKDYQYVTQVQAPLTIRNFYTVFKGLSDSFNSINLKLFALIAVIIILMTLVVLGSELVKKKEDRYMVGIMTAAALLVYGLLLLSMAVYIYNRSARKITSQGSGNMYTNFDNYVASRILTKASSSDNTSNFLNPFKTLGPSGLYMQQDEIIQQALTILGSNPPAIGERSVFDTDSSRWSGALQPDIFNIANTAVASAEAAAAGATAAEDTTAAAPAAEATTAATPAAAATTAATPAAAATTAATPAAAPVPSQDDNATTVAQALFTINMFLVYCDSKLTDTQNMAFTDLFSSKNYLSNTAPPFSAYLYRKYVAIPDRASIYKNDKAFDQFTEAGKRQGVALYQQWVREASNQYANFYPEEYYASVRNHLIIFIVVNMILMFMIGKLLVYLPNIYRMMEAAKQVASVVQAVL
jgi:hypothetical protein